MVSMDKVLRHHVWVSRLVVKDITFGPNMVANRVRILTRAVFSVNMPRQHEGSRIPLTLMVFVRSRSGCVSMTHDVTTHVHSLTGRVSMKNDVTPVPLNTRLREWGRVLEPNHGFYG